MSVTFEKHVKISKENLKAKIMGGLGIRSQVKKINKCFFVMN